MKNYKYNTGWKFWKDRNSFALVWSVPENAEDVTLPHDAMIEDPADPNSPNGGNTGYRNAEVYTYVKMIDAKEEWKDKTILLQFEGVYMNTYVYVNGQLAGKNPYGYTTFYVSLNDFLHYGETNEIRVQVRAGAMTNSRWYSGAGIYRDVYLLESGMTYVEPESVQVKTENADGEIAVLRVGMTLRTREAIPQNLVVATKIKDKEGNVVGKECTAVTLFEGEERSIFQRIAVQNPRLWSEETPDLYTCEVKLLGKNGEKEELLDEDDETFGIRTLSLDAKRGLRVNGKTVKLRGACIHHDSGIIGAATYEDAQYRQVRKLKEAGFNAIRMSHHPMAPAMLRACDALGVYVMDETFDMWNRFKNNYDYGQFFAERWESDVTAMVRKDYNHPCVVLYSVGNEIPEIGSEHGAQICAQIAEKIRSLDDTRYITAGINGVFAAGDAIDRIVADIAQSDAQNGTGGNVNDFMTVMDSHMADIVVHPLLSARLEKACASLDVAGYNYMTARYEKDAKEYPNRVIVGSETYPPQIAENWDLVEKLPHVIGDFTWTGWDYIGEAGVGISGYHPGEGGFGAVYPAQLAYVGDFDITGFRRPASYYREAVFGFLDKPYIAVQNPRHYGETLIKTPWVMSDSTSSWTWKGMEGKNVVIEVYAQGDEVELLVNGTSIGKKAAGRKASFRTLFETTYESGTLTAISYENGKETGRTDLKTAGGGRSLHVEVEPYEGPDAARQELIYVQVEMRDAAGTLASDDNQEISLTTQGKAEILGFGSADPKPKHNYNEGVTSLYGGRAQIILKKNPEPVTLIVTAQDGTKGVLELN